MASTITSNATNTITRDVCILGGGVSGSFAATRLRDAGLTVALVEPRGKQLGGHTFTFHRYDNNKNNDNNNDKQRIEAGVFPYRDSPKARQFFKRFGIRLVPTGAPPPLYVDFETDRPLELPEAELVEALPRYSAQLAKYPFLDDGFALPHPVPEDLLIPFGNFIEKHELGGIALLAARFCQGFPDVFSLPTLYVMKNFGSSAITALKRGFLVPDGVDNSELYRRVQTEFAGDVLFGKPVVLERDNTNGVRVSVASSSGQTICIHAQKLLVTLPPTPSVLAETLELDENERHLFEQFIPNTYHSIILKPTGLLPHKRIISGQIRPRDNPGSSLIVHELTSTHLVKMVSMKYSGLEKLSDYPSLLDQIRGRLAILQHTYPELFHEDADPLNTKIRYSVLSSPYGLTVPASAIQDGFYRKLNDLNGYKNTFWTGAAFQAHDASLIWEHTDRLLKKHFFHLSNLPSTTIRKEDRFAEDGTFNVADSALQKARASLPAAAVRTGMRI